MRKSILYIILFFSFSFTYGQITISGYVKSEGGEYLDNILLLLKQKRDSAIISYTYSDNSGNFILNYSGNENIVILEASGLGIVPQSKQLQNKTQVVNFVVKEKIAELKEVIIKAPKISYRKDTINYLVSAFSNDNDFVIGDVLRRMPGIDVAESGQISYQGRPINKFYIENLDLLNGRYGIATQNISVKDVASVQVMENHQPIKAMDSVRISDQAAINLKLKEGAKGTLSTMAQLGLGVSPLLWETEIAGMYFAKKRQNITTYKANNTGVDLSNELRSFNTSLGLLPDQYTRIHAPTPPNIDKKRYLFNNSNTATINNLFKIGQDKELNFNLIYYNDHDKRSSIENTSYFITNDSILFIQEGINSSRSNNKIETELRYNENSESKYLNNFLNIEGAWQNDRGCIVNVNKINQQLDMSFIKLQNNFHYIKKGGAELQSQIGYVSTPQDLVIIPGLYNNLLNNGQPYSSLKQEARTNKVVLNNKLILLSPLAIGNIIFNPYIGFNMEINHLSSQLYAQDEDKARPFTVADSMRNDLTLVHYKPYLGTDIRYKIGKFKLNITLPVSYNLHHLKNKINNIKRENLSQFRLEPTMLMEYKLTQDIDLSANAITYNGGSSINELHSGYILKSYRDLQVYKSNLFEYRGNSATFKVAYKDIFNMLFSSAEITHRYHKNDVTHSMSFNDMLSVSSILNMPNRSNTTSVLWKISKGFDTMNTNTGLDIRYYTSSAQQIRQSQLVDYKNNSVSISGKLSTKPLSLVILSYQGEWNSNKIKIKREESSKPIQTLNNTTNVDLTLFKGLRLETQFEHYYNNAVQNKRNIYFTDINIHYRWGKVDMSLNWTNIFNMKQYSQAYYSDINEYYRYYNIRHTNIMFKLKMKLK